MLNSSLRSASLVTLICMFSAATVCAAQHEFSDYRIAVTADTSAVLSEADYQITVEEDAVLLTRLTAHHEGTLSNSFVGDLNKDGNFEVVVTFSHNDGHDIGVHLYTWNEFRLDPIKVPDLDADAWPGYRGNDQFALVDGVLIRIFQVYERSGDDWVPTAQQQRLSYSYAQGRWLK